jgi:hypothetical protein
MDVAGLSETSVPICQTMWCDITGDSNLDSTAPYHVACTIIQAIDCYDSDGMVEDCYLVRVHESVSLRQSLLNATLSQHHDICTYEVGVLNAISQC